MFTAQYGLIPYIKQIRLAFKRLMQKLKFELKSEYSLLVFMLLVMVIARFNYITLR
jgi:hypothetical protein